jgi:hypothetical protein
MVVRFVGGSPPRDGSPGDRSLEAKGKGDKVSGNLKHGREGKGRGNEVVRGEVVS